MNSLSSDNDASHSGALRASEAQLRSFIEQAPVAIAMFDRSMICLAASRKWVDDYGRGRSELVGLSHYDVHPDLPDHWKQVHKKGLAGEKQNCDEDLWIQADGSRLWLRWTVQPWLDADGAIGGIMIFAENITARKRAEEALRESEARYRLLADNTEDFVTLNDTENRRLYVSPSFYRVTGWTPEEIQTTDWRTRMHADELPLIERTRAANLAGETTTLEHRIRCKDGRWLWVESRCKPIFGPNSRVRQLMLCSRDITDRKQTEEKFRESENLLRTVTDNAHVGLVMINRQRQYIFANTAYVEMLGLQLADIVGRRVPDVLADVYEQQIRPRLDRAFAGERLNYELRRPSSGGEKIYAVMYQPKMAEGEVSHVIVVIVDITDRKQTEEKLIESESLFRTLVHASSQSVWRYRPSSSPIHQLDAPNAAWWREFTGQSEAQRTADGGMGWLDAVHESDRATAKRMWLDIVTSNKLVQAVYRVRRHDGQWRWLAVRAVPLLFDAKGRVTEWAGAITDISERKNAEEALRESEARLSLVLSGANCLLWFAVVEMKNGHFTWDLHITNAEAGRHFIPLRIPPGGSYEDAYSVCKLPEDQPGMDTTARAALLSNKNSYSQEFRCRMASGEIRWLHEDVRVVPLAAHRWRLIGVSTDITERKSLEAQLRQSQKMDAVGQLAAGIAHDFNNLLTVILGHSELLMSQLSPGDKIHSQLRLIQQTGERAASLTRQLLAFSRRQMLHPAVLDCNAVVAEFEPILRRAVREDIAISQKLATGLRAVKADRGQLEQVILNLVVNARDAMPSGGKLVLETANVELDAAYTQAHPYVKAGPYVMLSVSDTGTGMAPELEAHIFEPFFTTKEQGKGTGLGLATVYGIVKQSGGHIEVYSEVGIGTTFKVYLPAIAGRAPAPSSGNLHSISMRGSETILLVEDEDAVRELVRDLLTGHGYKLLEARNGSEALHMAGQHAHGIHLLLTDVVMPDMHGPQLAERLLALNPNLKLLFMSGYTDQSAFQNGLLKEGAPFIQKPFTTKALAKKIREVLDAPAPGL